MKTPAVPENEADRLRALARYQVLDTPEETEFDDLARLAAGICGTPHALITFIDERRQWFKAHFGLPAGETPREVAFCAHAILGTELMEVPDARRDERFNGNPFVTSAPGVRFYAGVPLITDDGFALGTLCVVDYRPRFLSDEQREALECLARQVVSQLELRWLKLSRIDRGPGSGGENRLALSEQQLLDQKRRLLASAKLSELGEMAAGIAHEISNPLAIIQAKAEHLRELTASGNLEPQKFASDLERIRDTVERISRIVKGLKNFARNGDKDPVEPIDLNVLIEETLSFCEERYHAAHVLLDVDIASGCELKGRALQISQVLLNLLNNALHAVAGTKAPWVKVRIRRMNELVEFSVTDSGPGIEPEVAARIMEPFFTTKGAGVGTGLGLSIARGIIADHGGTLEYDATSPNTRFVFRLPALRS